MGSYIRTSDGKHLTSHADVEVFLRTATDLRGRLLAVFFHSAHTRKRCPQAQWRPEFMRTQDAVARTLKELETAPDKDYAKAQRAELERAMEALKPKPAPKASLSRLALANA